ncbi:hypothetical protein G3M53_46585, partial [Streptomyces sp. SID7982]|nr:hypothetical protein [Streptomyces sp. SID7982]
VERPELHQGPVEFVLSALYPLAALGFLAAAARVASRPGGAQGPDAEPAGRPVPEQRDPAGAEADRAGRQALAKE